MNKLYAVKYRNGHSHIYAGEWDSIRKHIDGKKGVKYKGFPITAHREAEEWLARKAIPYRTKRTPHVKDKLYLYVDGSFSGKTRRAGWGWAAILNDVVIAEDWGSKSNITGSRNIAGELYATISGLQWADRFGAKEVIVVHDYAGIGCWALGYWKTRKPVSKEYKKVYDDVSQRVKVRFEKVNGHCGIKWNDYVDDLTRKYMENSDGTENA